MAVGTIRPKPRAQLSVADTSVTDPEHRPLTGHVSSCPFGPPSACGARKTGRHTGPSVCARPQMPHLPSQAGASDEAPPPPAAESCRLRRQPVARRHHGRKRSSEPRQPGGPFRDGPQRAPHRRKWRPFPGECEGQSIARPQSIPRPLPACGAICPLEGAGSQAAASGGCCRRNCAQETGPARGSKRALKCLRKAAWWVMRYPRRDFLESFTSRMASTT